MKIFKYTIITCISVLIALVIMREAYLHVYIPYKYHDQIVVMKAFINDILKDDTASIKSASTEDYRLYEDQETLTHHQEFFYNVDVNSLRILNITEQVLNGKVFHRFDVCFDNDVHKCFTFFLLKDNHNNYVVKSFHGTKN